MLPVSTMMNAMAAMAIRTWMAMMLTTMMLTMTMFAVTMQLLCGATGHAAHHQRQRVPCQHALSGAEGTQLDI